MGSLVNDFFQIFVPMFSVLNPLGAIPVFLALTAGYSPEKLRSISISCAISVMIGLIVSAIMGRFILDFFSISIDAFRIGGGILIMINALNMIKGKIGPAKINSKELEDQKDAETIGIVPLAIPLLVGPGSISTAILYSKTFETTQQWSVAIFVFILLGVIVYLSQFFAKKIKRYLGEVGVNVMSRIMGLILIALGAEFIITGIKGSFSLS